MGHFRLYLSADKRAGGGVNILVFADDSGTHRARDHGPVDHSDGMLPDEHFLSAAG
eukprot:m.161814 g.161814  ORF g.161814 m.161814 type:complete len:56 (+) comp18055_c0_seq5:1489-1656(+)